jgi:hypothetical protein
MRKVAALPNVLMFLPGFEHRAEESRMRKSNSSSPMSDKPGRRGNLQANPFNALALNV